jgi:hypothetical protein
VLGSQWNGLKATKDREEQNGLERGIKCMSFSETFEVVKVDGEWKFSRIILIMHDDILGMYHEKGIDLLPGMFD